jgi:hypothetical protein
MRAGNRRDSDCGDSARMREAVLWCAVVGADGGGGLW